MTDQPCPVCKSESTPVGPVVHGSPALVAGVPIDLGDAQYQLLRCNNCTLQFKDPPISMDALMECYNASPESNWEHNPNPVKRRFDELQELTKAHSQGNRILDIGCSNGAILQYFGDSWDRFGIEPSTDAARVAEDRNITILAPTIETLDESETFDAILAIDLLEHLDDPDAFFARVMKHLKPGGIFLAFTGTTDASSWKLQGSRYWYASLPEHIVFYSKRTVEHLADKHNAEIVSYTHTSHQRASTTRKVRDSIRNHVWSLMLRLHGLGVPAWKRAVLEDTPPGWLSADDHMLFVIRKK